MTYICKTMMPLHRHFLLLLVAALVINTTLVAHKWVLKLASFPNVSRDRRIKKDTAKDAGSETLVDRGIVSLTKDIRVATVTKPSSLNTDLKRKVDHGIVFSRHPYIDNLYAKRTNMTIDILKHTKVKANCSHPPSGLPKPSAKPDTWHAIEDDVTYVFSAYLDTRFRNYTHSGKSQKYACILPMY